jgi:AcrR family transcriptional regulator
VPPRQPKQSRSKSVVGAVVTALEQLLDRAADGEEISMRTIAQRAGVGIGSVYDYFNGQEGLFGEFLERLTNHNFAKAQKWIDDTDGLPLEQALHKIFEDGFGLYLDSPRRTKAAIHFIARLGWVDPVIKERDRFATLLAARIRKGKPELDQVHTEATTRLVLDAAMGCILVELWRPTPDLKKRLFALVDATFERELGVRMKP